MLVEYYEPKALVVYLPKISKSSIQINPSLSISFDPFSLANKGLFGNQNHATWHILFYTLLSSTNITNTIFYSITILKILV
jgi:hypothetical protein